MHTFLHMFCVDSYFFQKKSDPEAGFNIEGLVVSCLDLIEAGTETATTTLRWGLLFIIKFPEIQGECTFLTFRAGVISLGMHLVQKLSINKIV